MTLDSALGIATRALSLAQEGITTSSNNLANISTPGYIRQQSLQASVVVNGSGFGAEITGISANVDTELLKSIGTQISSLGNADIQNTYFDSIQRLYGQPNSDDSLSGAISLFFSAYQDLSNNPETPSLRVAALNAAKDLASKVSLTASGLQDLRFSADKDIGNAVDTVNNTLSDIIGFNNEILNFQENTSGYINIKQKLNESINKLSQYINIAVTFDSHGKAVIATGNGVALLDDATTTKLEYSQASSVDTFINNGSLNALKVRILKNDGTASDASTNLATSGESTTVTTSLSDGSIYGLLKVRDNVVPLLLDQLDTLAAALTNEINAVQNDGYGFPPPSSLTGTTSVKNTDEVDFTGKVRIAVINNDGTPAPSPYSDETYYRPLTLDLSTLDAGQGAGRADIQTIIDEINDYYGPVQNRAVVGNLRNIQLTAISSSIGDNTGTAQFDLKLDNTSTKSATVSVLAVTLKDPAVPATTYAAGSLIPSPNSYVLAAGEAGRTGQPITVNFAGGTNLASYTLTVRVQVTDSSGNVSVADVDYTVGDNVTGIKNDKYNAQAVTAVSGTSQFIVAPGSSTYASASLVDSNGNAVSAGNSGFLKITTSEGRNYSIVIDELDSKEVGVPGASSSAITNRGFSHYFGLNNLFVDNGTTAGSAINLAVRSDIKTNANLLTTGQLTLSNQPTDTTTALYTYEAGSGNNKAALVLANLNQKSVFFSAAGDLPSINTTFGGYSADVIGSVSAAALHSTNIEESIQLGMDGLQTLFQKQAGVSSDEELSRIIELQNHFGASAQVINIVRQLFDVLSQALR